GPLMKAVRVAAFGARNKEIVAPASGPVRVELSRNGRIAYTPKPARSWFIFPAVNKEYTFYVNETPVKLQVPEDFDFDWTLLQITGWTPEQLVAHIDRTEERRTGTMWLTLDQPAVQGKRVLSFDIITGDQ